MIYGNILKHIATLGPLGYVPFAPGTFGSIAGALFVFFVPLDQSAQFISVIAGTVLGSIAATTAEKELKQKDSGKIIVDEFVGMLVSCFLLPRRSSVLIAAFLLFRFFDILKPLMIRRMEKMFSKGAGVMADDILAGIYTNALIQAILYFKVGT